MAIKITIEDEENDGMTGVVVNMDMDEPQEGDEITGAFLVALAMVTLFKTDVYYPVGLRIIKMLGDNPHDTAIVKEVVPSLIEALRDGTVFDVPSPFE